jgi:hypothetical protein
MKMTSCIVNALFLLMLIPSGCRAVGLEVDEKEEIKKSLSFSDASSPHKVVIDNINGSIDVIGYDGATVELTVHKTLSAESQKKMEEARKKISVDITQESDRIIVYVNTPWRYENGSIHYDSEDYGYDVCCNFELKVPKKTNLKLKTVNDGMIHVQDIQGDFEVRDINKSVEMLRIDGSGEVSTVNGDVEVVFAKNPAEASSFKTINGEVSVKFQQGFDADVSLKTMNGEVYTDFEFANLPSKAAIEKTGRQKKVYRSAENYLVRVGSGGPELTFNTLNGNIYIRQAEHH